MSEPPVRIRSAQAGDLEDVAAAYNAGIAERIATFETDPRTPDDTAPWLTDGRPFIVAERNGRAVGWARAGAYSDRCVYEGVGEHAVYVHPEARGQRLGRQLLSELCAESESHGLYKLTSRIFTDNHASRAAHRAAGFDEVGIQRRHGRLDGHWKTACSSNGSSAKQRADRGERSRSLLRPLTESRLPLSRLDLLPA